jgi:chaperonin GroEL (HSP60 family)
VKAVTAVVDEDGSVDTDNITVEKKVGGGITDSELVHGMVIDKDRLHPNMPKKVTGAKIALLNAAIEIEKTEVDAKIEITSPDQLQAFLDQEETMLKGMVDAIKATGANVVFCQKESMISPSTSLPMLEYTPFGASRRAIWRSWHAQLAEGSSPAFMT